MHNKILRYLFCNGLIYLGFWMFFSLFANAPSGPDFITWHIPVYPLLLLPMIFFNVLYLSGFLGDAIKAMEDQ